MDIRIDEVERGIRKWRDLKGLLYSTLLATKGKSDEEIANALTTTICRHSPTDTFEKKDNRMGLDIFTVTVEESFLQPVNINLGCLDCGPINFKMNRRDIPVTKEMPLEEWPSFLHFRDGFTFELEHLHTTPIGEWAVYFDKQGGRILVER